MIFVPQNLVESFENLVDMDVSKVAFLILMVLVEVPLCWIQDIRKLTPTNVLATILIACGLFSCLWIALSVMALDASTSIWDQLSNLPPSNSDTWYLFIGTSVSFTSGFLFLSLVVIHTNYLSDSFSSLKVQSHYWCHYKKLYAPHKIRLNSQS